MDDNSIKQLYKTIKSEMDRLMDQHDLDFTTRSKIMHLLTQDFDSTIKHRYP